MAKDTTYLRHSLAQRTASESERNDPALIEHRSDAFPQRGEWRRFWDLSLTLTRAELKRKYLGSVLGYAWTIVRPLMLFAVIYFVLSRLVRFGTGVPNYALYVLIAIVLWTYFSETTSSAVTSLMQQEGVLRKINFPRFAVPMSLALTSGFFLATNLVVVIVFLLASGITPTVDWLGAIPLIALLFFFTLGLSVLLATLFPGMRDLQPIWDVATQLLFWMSPIIYTADHFPADASVFGLSLESVLAASPISSILTELRHLVLDPSAPTASAVLGSKALLLIPLGIVTLVVASALAVFSRKAPDIAEAL